MRMIQPQKTIITVIGGGPAGMMAAVSAAKHRNMTAKPQVHIRILEKNDILGRKLLATGNGRCNLTNKNCRDSKDTLDFFSGIGLLTRTESEGRVYPYSEQASSVQEVLIGTLKKQQVEILCGCEVKAVEKEETGFQIVSSGNTFYSDIVILASGGKAGPQYGSTGDGYRFAKTMGHTIIRPMPSLVQLVSDRPFFSALKGVRAKGKAELLRNDQVIDSETGELQFTADGLSGICIFNLSKSYLQGDWIQIDLFPEYNLESLNALLKKRMISLEGSTVNEFFTGIIHKKLAPVLLNEIQISGERIVGTLTEEEVNRMAGILKEWVISITGTKGWKEAQVTSGGVELSEVDPDTMESKLIPKLYFAGELLNVDEKCGGYNLQWAWTSGFSAGKAAAEALEKHAKNT